MEQRLKTLAETVKQVEGVYPTKERMDRLRTDMEKCEGTSVCTPTPASEQPIAENNTSVKTGTPILVEVEYKTESQRMYERLDRLEKATDENIKQIERLQKTCSYLLSRDRSDSDLDYD